MEQDNDEHPSQHEKDSLDAKSTKSTRKKKAAASKKSKKKKSKQELQPNQFESKHEVLETPDSNSVGASPKEPERLEKTEEVGVGVEAKGESDGNHERQHSMPRSRSGSRSRFSSLFRRKKRCKSETDLRKERGGAKRVEGEEEMNVSENPRRKEKRHVSAEDLKKRQQQKAEDNLSPPLKSNLKRPSPFREFSPTAQPRDRLQHMTLKEVAKEQLERRSESLPRRRREYVSFNDMDQNLSQTASTSNLSLSALDSGDQSPALTTPHTLPRGGRYPSLTAQHSSNISPNMSPPLYNVGASSRHFDEDGVNKNDLFGFTNDNVTDRLQHPPDHVMETSQDSGVVVLGQQRLSPDSATLQSPKRQEKSSMEKLLELKQNFPHAFSYDSEKGTSVHSENKDQEVESSIQNRSSEDNTTETPTNIQNVEIGSTDIDAHSQYISPDYSLNSLSHDNNESDNKPNLHSSEPTHADSATTSPASTTQSKKPTWQQDHPIAKTESPPSFLIPFRESGQSSGASSRVTSMTSSHRSSDQGYVDDDESVPDDDDDDEDENDNSAFSTPPEDLVSEGHKHKSYVHPEMLEKYLSSVIENNAGKNILLPEIDVYDVESGKKMSPNATLPSYSRMLGKPYETYDVRKAKTKLKRSSSDVTDKRHTTPPKNYSGAFLGDPSNQSKTPVGSVETLSDLSLGNLQTPDDNLSKLKKDADGDTVSVTSTATLTHSDGKTLGQHYTSETTGSREEKSGDTKPVPVMGTTAQTIYRRNFSPLRSRKLYSFVAGNLQESPKPSFQPQKQRIPKTQIPEEMIHSTSFQPISLPKEEVFTNSSPIQSIDKENKDPYLEAGSKKLNELHPMASPSSKTPGDKNIGSNFQDSKQNKDSQSEPQINQTPSYLISGLELQENAPMSKNINSLVDCLNNQSIIAKKNEEKRKISVTKKDNEEPKPEIPVSSERVLKESTDIQQNENIDEIKHESKPVTLEDKECQTPPWLLDDLVSSKIESSKKPKGILGRRKKQSVFLKPIVTEDTVNKKEARELPSTSVSPSTPSTGEGPYMTPPSTATNDNDLILRLDAPISQESDNSNIALSAGPSKRDDVKVSDAPKREKSSSPVKETNAKPTPSKSKPLSLSAVILLKNRIAKYREKKREKKEIAAGKNVEEEEDKVEPDTPSDTFMTIENEINLSKLEVSRETDILDAEYFEPEFSLDYSKKQIRFDEISSNEPVQSEEPLPPLPPTATRRLRQRRESTMRERRRKCVSYCKRFVAFLFSHIGLCSLVVAYTIMGGFIFQALESHAKTAVKTDIITKRTQVLSQIISMAIELEKSEEGVDNLTSLVNSTLLKYQADIHHATKDQGWDGTEKMGSNEGVWSFASSLLYAITVTTTIGYGHVAPKTPEGRLVTIGYAVVGIPLTLLCLTNIGDVMATGFRLLYGKVCCGLCCTMFKPRRRRIPPDLEKGLGRTMITSEKEESDKPKEVIHVPTSLCLLLIAAYIFAGAMLFSMWEKWDILTGSYFCFITLSTIGFGDIVPGMETNAWSGEEKLVLCALYLVLGLSLIAMCFNLVQEDVKTKCRWLGMKLGIVDKPETPM